MGIAEVKVMIYSVWAVSIDQTSALSFCQCCDCWLGDLGIWPIETCVTYPQSFFSRTNGGRKLSEDQLTQVYLTNGCYNRVVVTVIHWYWYFILLLLNTRTFYTLCWEFCALSMFCLRFVEWWCFCIGVCFVFVLITKWHILMVAYF